MSKKIQLVVAVAKNNVIGKDNQLVWHLRDDMKFFKELTTGHIILSGRKNYESIPEKFRPLPNRLNCIVTRNESYYAPNCKIFRSIQSWYDAYKDDERELFIIGGGELYKQALDDDIVDVMYITHVNASPEGDTFFPNFDAKQWIGSTLMKCEKNERNEYDFEIVKYTKIHP
jgi:dihydrofolate reductase